MLLSLLSLCECWIRYKQCILCYGIYFRVLMICITIYVQGTSSCIGIDIIKLICCMVAIYRVSYG